jgi:small subunit ribosomal protein S7
MVEDKIEETKKEVEATPKVEVESKTEEKAQTKEAPTVKAETPKTETKAEPSKTASKPAGRTFDRPRRDFKSNSRFDRRDNYNNAEEVKLPVFVKKVTPFDDYKLFNKWAFKDVVVSDLSLVSYINLDPVIIPHSFGRKSQGRFAKMNINIVERLINKAMRSGQGKRKLSGRYIRGRNGCGKKLQVMQIVEDAFTLVEEKTKTNPIQVLIQAIQNSAPREDVTRMKRGGVAYSIAVDVSPLKRLDAAIKNLALAGFGNSFNNKTEASVALAEEIISASKNDIKSIAIKRRDEVERIAKASR